ncbi:MAG TPA: hypothetical protein VMU88_00060 [bacterium]|nr:hypothetical protein [bacterium]
MEGLPFKDHGDAARQLADKLCAHRGENPMVLAFPGESWAMGKALAEALEGELENALAVRISGPAGTDCAALYGADIPPYRVRGRTVILMAEETSTGSTFSAIARELRRQDAAHVIAASAVGCLDSVERLRREMDETIVLLESEEFKPAAVFFSDSVAVGREP